MNRYLSFLFLLFTLTFADIVPAQEIPLQTWRDHLPYGQTHAVTASATKVYCAAKNSLFYIDKTDNTVNRLTTKNGLSDVEVATIAFNEKTQVLVIAYKNGNIDLRKENGDVVNLSFIKNDDITGNKEIFEIDMEEEFAYLSTGFGIVILNTKREEITDTYFVGNAGNLVSVFDVELTTDTIFAATENGVFFGARKNNLKDFRFWLRDNGLPNVSFNIIETMDDKMLVNYNPPSDTVSDTVFVRTDGKWENIGALGDTGVVNINFALEVYEGEVLVPQQFHMWIFDEEFEIIDKIYTYNFEASPAPEDVIKIEDEYWVADRSSGLVKLRNSFQVERILINSPESELAFDIDIQNGTVWTVAGGYGNNYNNLFTFPRMAYLEEGNWTNFSGGNNPSLTFKYDLISVAADPNTPGRAFVASWGTGLYELEDGEIIKTYDNTNQAEHSLNTRIIDESIYVGGVDFDENSNLWMTNPFNNRLISVLTPEGEWRSFNLQGRFSLDAAVGQVMADRNNNVWALQHRDNRIIVYNHNGTPTDLTDDPIPVIVNSAEGTGNLPGDRVMTIAEDNNNEIWIGTNEGIAVIFNPSSLFTGGEFDAQQILIQQDGVTQILFESETITAIAIDGANRKWIGTQNAGVFLMSEDGTEQVAHFTTENSPLFSDFIRSIAINHETGEVFIATDKGLVSYRGTSTVGGADMNDVTVFPNPVKPNYNGLIAINGLTDGAIVKITDAQGGLVYETESLGGQAVWNGNNFDGNRVSTGVYLIFSASSNGELTNVSKVMILN